MSRRRTVPATAAVTVPAAVTALAVALVAVLALVGCTGESGAPGVAVGTTVEFPVGERKTAPAVRGELLGGGSYDLASHRGDVVVVNFWASWCPPCRVEAADLERTYQATKAAGVSFVGVNTRDTRDKAATFLQARGSTYPSIFDPSGRVALGFTDVPPQALPATLIVDREGRIAAVIRISVRESELRPIVDRVAAEARLS